ncbi:MAG: AhpC/TSA family protein [Bacteroides sp.]|nr:AhpC/TSA family protein [Bacteroides sp.]
MKKISVLGLGALAVLCACSSKPSSEYKINGTTDLADGEMIYLMYQVAKDSTFTDSVAVANGTFAFSGNVATPKFGYVSHGPIKYINEKVRPMMIEPGEITVALTGDDYSNAEVTGSPLTAQADSLSAVQMAVYEQMKPLQEQYMAVKDDSVKVAALMQSYDSLNNLVKESRINFVKTHPASYYSPVVMSSAKTDLSLDELKEIYNSWTPEVQASDPELGQYIVTLELIQPGAAAPEISGKDQNGNDVTLSGLKGKVVLLDFWATWCGPCRASLPHVKELYEQYNGKGLEVLAVSLDRDQEKWKDYIANSGMGMEKYANVYDEGGVNADKYAIQYIPSKFIIDAEGNIVGRFDDEAELNAKLAELLK